MIEYSKTIKGGRFDARPYYLDKSNPCKKCEGVKFIRKTNECRYCTWQSLKQFLPPKEGKTGPSKVIHKAKPIEIEKRLKCAICGGKNKNGKPLFHDHCHKTGKTRGYLCCGCNTGLGLLGDNIEGLERALAYLKRAEGIQHAN